MCVWCVQHDETASTLTFDEFKRHLAEYLASSGREGAQCDRRRVSVCTDVCLCVRTRIMCICVCVCLGLVHFVCVFESCV